jgi:hypothetical protein
MRKLCKRMPCGTQTFHFSFKKTSARLYLAPNIHRLVGYCIILFSPEAIFSVPFSAVYHASIFHP